MTSTAGEIRWSRRRRARRRRRQPRQIDDVRRRREAHGVRVDRRRRWPRRRSGTRGVVKSMIDDAGVAGRGGRGGLKPSTLAGHACVVVGGVGGAVERRRGGDADRGGAARRVPACALSPFEPPRAAATWPVPALPSAPVEQGQAAARRRTSPADAPWHAEPKPRPCPHHHHQPSTACGGPRSFTTKGGSPCVRSPPTPAQPS